MLDSFWGILVLCALSLAVFIQVNIKQSEKIEELEKRIKALEDEKNGG